MRIAILATAVLAAVVAAGAAQAAFPGSNGAIVFRSNRTGDADIYTMNPDGTSRVDLTRNPAEDVDPRWSPDGTEIAFASNRTGRFGIYTMNADGSDVRQVTSPSTGGDRRPAWTADGRIAFTSNRDGNNEVYVVNADGSGLADLTNDPSYDGAPATSPHGNRIVFGSNREGDFHLYVLAGGGAPRALTSGSGHEDVQPNWSPSGNAVVFVRFDPTFATSDVYVVQPGGEVRQLTATPDRQETEPAWSPDGSQIVFHGCSALGTTSQHCANYVMNADGTGEHEVTQTYAAGFVDDFSSTPLDEFWSSQVTGHGPTVQQANGRLELTVPAATTLDPNVGYAMPTVFSKCNLRGDFDIQVDYALTQWPTDQNDVLALFNEGNFVGGSWQSADGLFVSKWGISGNFPDVPNAFVPGSFTSGSMRLARTGSVLTATYLDAGVWNVLQSRSDLVADESDAALAAFVNQVPTASGDVTVTYDNFRINSGTVACPWWWDDNAPDWQAK